MTRPDLAERREVEQVYGVAEDSELLADAVVERVEAGQRVLDVGTGSGYVADRLADTGATVVGSDLNPYACRQARERGLSVVRADLVAPFVDGAFDLVAFNPPYLPTPPEAEWDDWMEHALSGGEDGRAVVDPFLRQVGRVLAEGGTVLMLVSSLTGVDDVRSLAAAEGFESTVVAESSHPFERLVVLELERTRD